MKILDHCIIYTADDEEPDCGMCDNQDCEHCGNFNDIFGNIFGGL